MLREVNIISIIMNNTGNSPTAVYRYPVTGINPGLRGAA